MPEVKDVKPAVTKDEEDDEDGTGKGKKKKKQKEEEELKRKKELSEEEKQVWKSFGNFFYSRKFPSFNVEELLDPSNFLPIN